MTRNFTIYIERDPETKLLAGEIPGIPGLHTQAETMDELIKNLKEVIDLCKPELRKNRGRNIQGEKTGNNYS